MQIVGPHCRVLDSEAPDGARDYSSKFPGDGDAAGLCPQCEDRCFRELLFCLS